MKEKDATSKPVKPRPDYPLTAHASGKWCKKIRGRFHYFGWWADPDGAERLYDRVKHDLRAGRVPVVTIDTATLTVRELFNAFLSRQMEKTNADRIDGRSYVDQMTWLTRFAKHVNPGRLVTDLHPGDFASFREQLAGKSPHTINRAITQIKSPFRFALANGLVTKPVVFGDDFAKAAVSEKRKHGRGKKRHFEAVEVRKILAAADSPLKAMILLGINCGFYAKDCADLRRWAIDVKGRWLEFAREKTGVNRQCPLWPETVAAIEEAIKDRPKAKTIADDDRVFLTKYGNPWVHNKRHRNADGDITKESRIDPVGHEFTALLKRLNLRKPGLGFSALRKTFRTNADEANDRNAALLIMGQSFSGMDEWYVKALVKKRLLKVSNHVRKTLLNAKKVSA